ncbi:MAG: hypothetical protein LJE65_05840 [Desulfobacteraceae bacterium]|nr:hypothetical protein [Desulfobacteraceae bacterium]
MKRAMVGILAGLLWLPWMNMPADCQVTGKKGNWLRLLLRDGSTGWIHQSLIARDDTP